MLSMMLMVLVGALSGGEAAPVEVVHEPVRDVSMEVDIATGHIVMPVWIEDDGPYWFVLDTGNQQTTFFAYVAEEAGLETKPLGDMGGAGSGSLTVEQANDVRVSIGQNGKLLSFTDDTATVLPDAAQLPDFNGKQIAGFLGASLIEKYMTTIDYDTGELFFNDHDVYLMPDDAKVMQIKMAMGFPYFEGQITPKLMGKATEPVVGNFLLDLGATYAIDLDYEQAKELGLVDADDPDQRLAGHGQGIDGVMFEMREAPLASATLGGMKLDEKSVLFMTTQGGGPPIENLVGNIGSGLFDGGRVTLDYEGGRLIWED
jgi:hypothetical protein